MSVSEFGVEALGFRSLGSHVCPKAVRTRIMRLLGPKTILYKALRAKLSLGVRLPCLGFRSGLGLDRGQNSSSFVGRFPGSPREALAL